MKRYQHYCFHEIGNICGMCLFIFSARSTCVLRPSSGTETHKRIVFLHDHLLKIGTISFTSEYLEVVKLSKLLWVLLQCACIEPSIQVYY